MKDFLEPGELMLCIVGLLFSFTAQCSSDTIFLVAVLVLLMVMVATLQRIQQVCFPLNHASVAKTTNPTLLVLPLPWA
jgi:hypothetical protein